MSDLKTPQEAVEAQKALMESDEQAKEILEKAQNEKSEEDENEASEAIADHAKNNSEAEQYEYLVRGATLVCRNGSHRRKINLPKCHGVYVGAHPVLHELECVTELECGRERCNVTYFGVCKPEEGGAPPDTPEVVCKMTEENSRDGSIGDAIGHRCAPEIIGTWMDTFPMTRIVDNGDKNPSDREKADIAMGNIEKDAESEAEEPEGEAAVTMKSFLVCKYGGIIEPILSGQDEEMTEDDVKEEDKDKYDKMMADDAKAGAGIPVEKGGEGDPKGSGYDEETAEEEEEIEEEEETTGYDTSLEFNEDEKLFITVVAAESIGQGKLAWEVVANVIMNRIGQREWVNEKTARAVMEKEGAFSCLNDGGSSEFHKARNYLENRIDDNNIYEQLISVIMPIYNREVADITSGAQLYYSPQSMIPPGSEAWWAPYYKKIDVEGIKPNEFVLFTGERIK